MSVPRIALGETSIARLLVGGWQLSQGHRDGGVDESRLFADLHRMVEAGLTTFDCADIYTGVEELFGRFARDVDVPLQIHTKYVPDLESLATLDREDVARTIDRSLLRLGVERLDLVQFSWWDYAVPGIVDAAGWLDELRRAGKIHQLGLTNVDVAHTRQILDAGVPLVCNQVQYSLFDRRPQHGMTGLAAERGLALLCYGTLAGGLLSSRYLGQDAEAFQPATRSLVKYRLIVDEFGGWDAYQRLLGVLATIARRHAATIPAVALRWVLDRPTVAGAIVGTYHGGHLDENLAALRLAWTDQDRQSIAEVLSDCPGPVGDVFDLERDPEGPHGRIMWKNLNRARS